ncbi:hypothetical protein BN871_GR_00180 [Paenibacillus sp. P22]|nr:hypothetical protein BN871_GR_00180 [Paenibacillus sp. P22]
MLLPSPSCPIHVRFMTFRTAGSKKKACRMGRLDACFLFACSDGVFLLEPRILLLLALVDPGAHQDAQLVEQDERYRHQRVRDDIGRSDRDADEHHDEVGDSPHLPEAARRQNPDRGQEHEQERQLEQKRYRHDDVDHERQILHDAVRFFKSKASGDLGGEVESHREHDVIGERQAEQQHEQRVGNVPERGPLLMHAKSRLDKGPELEESDRNRRNERDDESELHIDSDAVPEGEGMEASDLLGLFRGRQVVVHRFGEKEAKYQSRYEHQQNHEDPLAQLSQMVHEGHQAFFPQPRALPCLIPRGAGHTRSSLHVQVESFRLSAGYSGRRFESARTGSTSPSTSMRDAASRRAGCC